MALDVVVEVGVDVLAGLEPAADPIGVLGKLFLRIAAAVRPAGAVAADIDERRIVRLGDRAAWYGVGLLIR